MESRLCFFENIWLLQQIVATLKNTIILLRYSFNRKKENISYIYIIW